MVAMKQSPLCMTDVLNEYDRLREGFVCRSEFWDVVVLTTSDAAQQKVYELEIANKLEQKELPSCASYHVVHDPPGPKIGSGGSTMYTLSEVTMLEPEWRSKKILLMHAGGSSQRLPSASVLGKAFTTIPIGNRIYTMFDVKLALCMPFAKRLPPGVFICCPDTFETFTFGNGSDWDFDNKRGFLAIAHPSPMYIGTGHGVFVLSDRNTKMDTEVLPCTKVLQKPTERMMREEGAVIRPSEVPEDIKASVPANQEWVFTDSNYFFDHSISDKLLGFYEENKPLTSEIDAYGDFLQPLGSRADASYINNCKNIMTMSSCVLETRRRVYELLKQSPLSVIALKQSKFYHIGTLGEYIENFCSNGDLKKELGLSTFCYSACVSPSSKYSPQSVGGGCVIHSLISERCSFSARSVTEYCNFTAPAGVVVQNNCVISNCEFEGDGRQTPLVIPENTFMQTVPVLDPNGVSKYVTLMFSINDDMKSKVSCLSDISNISYFDRSLLTVSEASDSLLTDHTEIFGQGNPYALWNAKLFHLSDNPQTSFVLALSTLKNLVTRSKRSLESTAEIPASADPDTSSSNRNGGPIICNGVNGTKSKVRKGTNGVHAPSPLYSFADVIKYKDARHMIEGRNELSALIKQTLAHNRPCQS